MKKLFTALFILGVVVVYSSIESPTPQTISHSRSSTAALENQPKHIEKTEEYSPQKPKPVIKRTIPIKSTSKINTSMKIKVFIKDDDGNTITLTV